MTIAIMQPYFLPYIGYWQLISAVDIFVVYDNIQYTKKGWINRNRFLQNSKDAIFTLPLKKDSDYLDVKDRIISKDFNKQKLISQLQNAYIKAPYFKENFHIIESIIKHDSCNLFDYIYNSIIAINKTLNIQTKILISSTIGIDHSLKSQEKVIAICKKLNATKYVNAIGGIDLYSKEEFLKSGVELKFIKTNEISYKQFNNCFLKNLSILDIIMFNNIKDVQDMLNKYNIIEWGGVNLLLEIGNLKYTATKELKWAS